MATARISAVRVRDAAVKKAAEYRELAAKAKKSWFDERLRDPVKRGRLWWRFDHYRSQSELEAAYVHTDEYNWRSAERNVEGVYWKMISASNLLRDVAKSAMAHGDSYVTLDANDSRFLGLEATS